VGAETTYQRLVALEAMPAAPHFSTATPQAPLINLIDTLAEIC
jgi:hypothetical protein